MPHILGNELILVMAQIQDACFRLLRLKMLGNNEGFVRRTYLVSRILLKY